MKIFEDIMEQRKILIAYKCDMCRRTYDINDDVFEAQEFLHIDFTAGYASVFGDMNTVKADICQHCLKEVLGHVLRIEEGWNIYGKS